MEYTYLNDSAIRLVYLLFQVKLFIVQQMIHIAVLTFVFVFVLGCPFDIPKWNTCYGVLSLDF